MPLTIREITSEVVLRPDEGGPGPGGAGDRPAAGEDEQVERVVRLALERVLERLRLEWER